MLITLIFGIVIKFLFDNVTQSYVQTNRNWTEPVSSLPLDILKLHTHRRPPTELSLCRSAISYCYVWLGDINRATMLLTKIPEAKSDLYVYQWWWETHERTELAEKASMISLELER
jgi:hypothetical protein